MTHQPSSLLVWWLRVLWSRDAANAAVGDALEELAERYAAGRAPTHPRLWIHVHLTKALVAAVATAIPRLARTLGLTGRDAFRSLRSTPWHSAFIVGVLAVAMTLASVTFAVVEAVILKPLPYPDADQLVLVSPVDEKFQVRITADVFWRLRDELRTVESVSACFRSIGSAVTVDGQTVNRTVARCEANRFQQLGLRPGIGRFWSSDEVESDARVAVVGHRFWVERLGGTADVLNRAVVLGEGGEGTDPYRIVGVLSAESDHSGHVDTNADVWVPLRIPRTASANRVAFLARMRPGVTPRDLSLDVQRVAGTPDWEPRVTRLEDLALRADSTRWMWLALAASVVVVLVACGNAANLMLTRAASRSHELAVRASLGATRTRLAATMMAEGIILALAAGGLGVLAAVGGARATRALLMELPLGIFRVDTIAVDGRVIGAAVVGALCVGVAVAIVAAWGVTRVPVSGVLKGSDGSTTTGRRRWASTLLVAEVTGVVVLSVVSLMFVGSLVRMLRVDLGVDTNQLVAVKSRFEFRGPIVDVKRRLEALPGVTGVSMSLGTSLPIVGRAYGGVWGQTQLRRTNASGQVSAYAVHAYQVTPNYFDVAGLRLLQGGTWADDSVVDSPSVVVDARVARDLFGTENPLGQVLRPARSERDYRIVGVVPFVPVQGPEAEVVPSAYFSTRFDASRTYAEFFVRTTEPVDAAVVRIADALKPIGPPGDEPYVFTAGQALRRVTAMRRFTASMMSVFGIVGVLIGAAGVYAVMASVVAQQSRDIGIRMALGATAQRIRHGVFTMAARHVVLGLLIGIPTAWWISEGFASLLFGVTRNDMTVYLGVVALLALTAALAAWVPARRASRVDPIVTLKG